MCCARARLQAPQLPLARSLSRAWAKPGSAASFCLCHSQAHVPSCDHWLLELSSIRPSHQGSLDGMLRSNNYSNSGSSKEPSRAQQQQRKSLFSVCEIRIATCFRLRQGQPCSAPSLPTSASAVLIWLPSSDGTAWQQTSRTCCTSPWTSVSRTPTFASCWISTGIRDL